MLRAKVNITDKKKICLLQRRESQTLELNPLKHRLRACGRTF